MTNEETRYFEAHPKALPLYEEVRERILGCFPDARINVQKSQIKYSSTRGFAYIWLPPLKVRGRPEEYIVLSFILDRKMEHPRIEEAAKVRSDRWTHHIILSDPLQIDDEILAWLKQAMTLADRKAAAEERNG